MSSVQQPNIAQKRLSDVQPRVAWVTIVTCVLMLAGYLLQQVDPLPRLLQLVPAQLTLWSLLTTCFLHANLAHLLGNLAWLLLFGSLMEPRTQRLKYLLVLWGGGVVASATQTAVVLVAYPERSASRIVGASGMVAALIGAFAVRFYATEVRLGKVSLPSLWITLLWFVPQLGGALRTLAQGGLGTVGYWGHLGGFLTGMVLALALRMTQEGTRSYLMQRLRQAQERGDLLEALRIAEGWSQLEPASVQAHRTAARTALSAGEEALSLNHYRQCLTLCEQQGDTATGVEVFLELRRQLPDASLSPEIWLRWGLRAAQAGYYREAMDSLQQLAEVAADTPEGENALLQAARIALRHLRQPKKATSLLQRFLERYPHSALTAYAQELWRQAQEAVEEK